MSHSSIRIQTWLPTVVLSGMTGFAGCQATPIAPTIDHQGWEGSVVLRNDVAEAVVVPQIGRVLSLRLLDGDNVLWTDPALYGQLASEQQPGWENFGGDRLWPWPQAEWATDDQGVVLNPDTFDQTPLKMTIESDAVVLEGSAGVYGNRFERRISLVEGEASLRIENRITKPRPGTCAWQVTQIPIADRVVAKVDPGADLANLQEHMFGKIDFTELMERPQPDQLIVNIPEQRMTKTGVATDHLAAEYPAYRISLIAEEPEALPIRTDRGQLWFSPNFMELELIGQPSTNGEDAVLVTRLVLEAIAR
ncbi:MAG: hypothetical protein AAGA25_15895 [Planctomycetota bacterium]